MSRTGRGNPIPHGVQNKLGDVRLEKGRWGNDKEDSIYILAWDFAEDCTGIKCPLYEKCEYMQIQKSVPCERTSKCALQQKYLKSVMKAVVEKMKKNKATEETVIKLGYHLIPLYAQLFKFKMWETYNKEIIIYSQGSPKVHPVYKEMREIIKTLTSVWKDIGSVFKEKADPGKVGDGAFIDAMYGVVGDEESEEDPKGSGIDFESEDDEEESEEGTGLDELDQPVKKKKARGKQKNYHKKKRKPRSKAKIDVPGYNSRAHRNEVRKGEKAEPIRVSEKVAEKKRKRKEKQKESGES
jgi:hypothetical protein